MAYGSHDAGFGADSQDTSDLNISDSDLDTIAGAWGDTIAEQEAAASLALNDDQPPPPA